MAITITAQPAKITPNGILVKTVITADDQTAFVSIYAKPCSPYCFWVSAGTYENEVYEMTLNDSLPIDWDYNPENIMDVAVLFDFIVKNGNKTK